MSAVLFDFGGTLDDDGVPWKERVARLFRDEGVVVAPERFDPVFYAADDALVGAIPRTLSLRETVERLIDGVAVGLGVRDDGLVGRVATRFVAGVRDKVRANTPSMTALGRRYRLGVVSNFYGNLTAVCGECGIGGLFGAIVDSEAVGSRKPDPRIFHTALAALGVAPAAAAFVGDSASRDMAGARAVGMPHIWMVAGEARPGEPCCPGDHVVGSLEDVEALLL